MRFWLACVLGICAWPSLGFSQSAGISVSGSIPHHAIPIPPIGNEFGDRHHCHGPRPAPGYGYGGDYGPGYGYGVGYGFNSAPWGYNYSGYSTLSYGVPGFSVGYSAPLFGPTYYGPAWGGYSGWNAPIYAPPPVYVTNQPTLPALPQWMIDEAQLDPNQPRKARPISQTHRSLVQPSTPEAQLRSVRMQAAGDRLFVNLDYSAAEKSYAKSIQAAPDRPDPYVRLAVAKAARGDFRNAVIFLKQMADIDPTYPARADSLDTLYGHQNGISKIQLKQRVADWAKVDIRDTDRIYLLGIVLFLDGDDRFRTVLDTVVKLDGELPHLTAFLETVPAQGNSAIAPTPDELDALAAPPVEPAAATAKPAPPPLLLPALAAPPAP